MRAAARLSVILLALAAVPAVAAPAGPVDAVSPEQAHRHVVQLAGAIGPRAAATEGERRAGAYIAETLRGYGYAVEMQPVQVQVFEAVRTEVALVRPDARRIEAAPLDQSPSSDGPIEAPLAGAGLADPPALAGRDLRGRVALIERGTITFAAKVRNVEAAGAVAALIYNNVPGTFQGTLGSPSRIPALALSREAGLALAAALDAGAVVRVDVETRTETRAAQNVVATRPGPAGSRTLVVGGHYDSVPIAPGANDNASGIAVLLETARVLRDVPLPFTVRFVAFAAEEIGLVGSRAYVERAREPMLAMINLDMEGIGQRFVAAIAGHDASLADRAVQVARRAGVPMGRIQEDRSDHASFVQAGVPAVLIHRPDDPLIHTPQDRVERIDPAMLAAPLRVTVALVLDLAGR